MSYDTLVEQVLERIGMDTRAQAEAALHATMVALGERLAAVEVAAIAGRLPDKLRAVLHRPRGARAVLSAAQIYARVSELSGTNLARAAEETRVVCQVLAGELDSEGMAHMQRLPADVAELFVPRSASETSVQRRIEPPVREHTLSGGRSGSTHPVSEAEPRRAQSESVASARNPHEKDKLSSAPKVATAQRGADLASGKPGSSRPLSEGKS